MPYVVDVKPGCADIPELKAVHLIADSYIILIMTDHISDEATLRQVIESPVHYIGMIDSHHKCNIILVHLHLDGVSEEAFAPHLHAYWL